MRVSWGHILRAVEREKGDVEEEGIVLRMWMWMWVLL